MTKKYKLIGKKFGKLTVKNEIPSSKKGKAKWKCVCECGGAAFVQTSNLTNGHTRSCGCLKKWSPGYDENRKRIRLYNTWSAMKDRCKNQNNQAYRYYGGKGISVCSEWLEFVNFYKWAMANGYNDNFTIDRKDSNKGYSPTNCRWIPMNQQFLNKDLGEGRGVSWDKERKIWKARVTLRGKEVFHKYFKDYGKAVNAAKEARKFYFKEQTQ